LAWRLILSALISGFSRSHLFFKEDSETFSGVGCLKGQGNHSITDIRRSICNRSMTANGRP
jgi:hypothetical protein